MLSIIKQTLVITGFVSVMMLVIEYLNVMTNGRWQERLASRPWGQYLLAAFLGATPGCLGAFAVVAMYAHRRLSVGAVVAAMVATSGDESFVLFAMVPQTALLLTGLLFVVGVASGILTDKLLGRRLTDHLSCETGLRIHEHERCGFLSRAQLSEQWKNCTPTRGVLATALLLFFLAIATRQIGEPEWNWIQVSLALTSAVALAIVATVPDHFLEEHLWKHVVRGHVLRIFLWTLGALTVLHFAVEHWQMDDLIGRNPWLVLILAGLVGLIPESGPHMIFVTLFAKGLIPFSVLLASSIVQDGHGMLPMLAHSRRAFAAIKLINLLVGLALGGLLMALGH